MSLIINLQNIEELLFFNSELQKKLTRHKHLFDTWRLAKRSNVLKSLGTNAISGLLSSLSEEDLKVISDFFKKDVLVDSPSGKSVRNISTNCDFAEFELPKDYNYIDMMIYKNKEKLEVTLWK